MRDAAANDSVRHDTGPQLVVPLLGCFSLWRGSESPPVWACGWWQHRQSPAVAGSPLLHVTDNTPPPPSRFTKPPPPLTKQVSAEDKKTVLEAVKEALEWVEENSEADADEFNDKRKEVRTGAQ